MDEIYHFSREFYFLVVENIINACKLKERFRDDFFKRDKQLTPFLHFTLS